MSHSDPKNLPRTLSLALILQARGQRYVFVPFSSLARLMLRTFNIVKNKRKEMESKKEKGKKGKRNERGREGKNKRERERKEIYTDLSSDFQSINS